MRLRVLEWHHRVAAIARVIKQHQRIDAREFAGILAKAGIDYPPADVRAIVQGLDQDGNGELDVKELLDGIRAAVHAHARVITPQREARRSTQPPSARRRTYHGG